LNSAAQYKAAIARSAAALLDSVFFASASAIFLRFTVVVVDEAMANCYRYWALWQEECLYQLVNKEYPPINL